MGLSPSEKSKLLRDVKALKDDIDSVNAKQDSELASIGDDIKALFNRMNAMQKQINDLLMAQKMGECNCKEPETPKKAAKK